jgi:hypothetical protein
MVSGVIMDVLDKTISLADSVCQRLLAVMRWDRNRSDVSGATGRNHALQAGTMHLLRWLPANHISVSWPPF